MRAHQQGLRPDPEVPSHLEYGVHCARAQGTDAVTVSNQGIWAGKGGAGGGHGGQLGLGQVHPPTPTPSMDSCPGVDTIC